VTAVDELVYSLYQAFTSQKFIVQHVIITQPGASYLWLCTRYCTAALDKRVRSRSSYTTADSAVSYLNHAQIA